MFNLRLLQTIKKYYKNQLDAITQTGFDKDFVYRATKCGKFEIIEFLRKLVELNSIRPEELYILITGKGAEAQKNTKAGQPDTYVEHLLSEIKYLRAQNEELLKKISTLP